MEKTYKFELPQREEVESTNVRIKDGKVFVDVKFKERFQPKDGDFLVLRNCIFIYNPNNNTTTLYGYYAGINSYDEVVISKGLYNGFGSRGIKMRYATPEEKSAFLERLEKECGKRWNPETKQIEDIRWRAEKGQFFYYVNGDLSVLSLQDSKGKVSDGMYKTGNYFRTPEAAQKVADQIKEIFKNSKAE